MDVLTGIGMGVWFAALFARALGRLAFHRTCGCYAIACGLWSVDDIRTGAQLAAVVTAAMCAAFAYVWWRGGGATVLAAVFVLCGASSRVCAVPRRP